MTMHQSLRSVTLGDGVTMPTIGLGVYMIMNSDVCQRSVQVALDAGYRLVDTAVIYGNERAVGRGIAASGVPREDVFVTTKLWPRDYGRDAARRSIDASLERLGTGYIDLMLLHQPFADHRSGWAALEDAVDAGKIRSIGVSNFEIEDLEALLTTARIRPVVNQIEMHPYYQRPELVAYLRGRDIAVESWAPLGHGNKKMLRDPVLTGLAQKHDRHLSKVLLRWHLQSGFIAIPKSTDPAHIASNLDVFDFELTDDDMATISAMDTARPNLRVSRRLQGLLLPRLSPHQLH